MKLTIKQLAKKYNLSRSTLLYYDKIGLLKPVARTKSGYRVYDEQCQNVLKSINTYRELGFKLKEIIAIVHTKKTDLSIFLNKRLLEIGTEISKLKKQKELISNLLRSDLITRNTKFDVKKWITILKASGMSQSDMNKWHTEFEKNAPDAHHAFLLWLGLSEKYAAFVRNESKK